MPRKTKRPNLFSRMPSLLAQIEKSRANKNINISKVKYMQNRIVELGAYKKKKFVPFKEGMKKVVDEKEKKKADREMKVNVGLPSKRKVKKRS